MGGDDGKPDQKRNGHLWPGRDKLPGDTNIHQHMFKEGQKSHVPGRREESQPFTPIHRLLWREGGQYQPGGTCTSAIDQWASRVNGKGEDPERMDRWSTLRVQVKGTVITFITAYMAKLQ